MPVKTPDRGLFGLILYHRPEGNINKLTVKEPLPLLCAGNKHLIEHQLDWLSDQGFKKVRLALNDRSQSTQALVGNGFRWGSRVSYCLDPEELGLIERLRKHRSIVGEGMLILEGNAFCRGHIPAVLSETCLFYNDNGLLPLLFCCAQDLDLILAECNARSVKQICFWVKQHLKAAEQLIDAFYHDLVDLEAFWCMTNEMLLNPQAIRFLGQQIGEGILLGRRASLADGACAIGPVIVGDAAVSKAALIGPQVFIGNNALIDEGARVAHSVIAPHTYVGRNTTLVNKYVCRDYVVDLVTKQAITVDDPMILADLTCSMGSSERLEHLLALLLLTLLLPLLILLLPLHRLLRGCWFAQSRILVQPVRRNLKNDYDYTWATWQRFDFGLFLLDMIPSLGDVASGKLSFVGNPPIQEQDLMAMEGPFMDDQLRGKAGLTGMVQQLSAESASLDEVFATTIYYNATQSIRGDFKLFFKALLPGVHSFKR